MEDHKYPKAVFFIIGNEFCERFSFFGLRGVLYHWVMSMSLSSDWWTWWWWWWYYHV